MSASCKLDRATAPDGGVGGGALPVRPLSPRSARPRPVFGASTATRTGEGSGPSIAACDAAPRRGRLWRYAGCLELAGRVRFRLLDLPAVSSPRPRKRRADGATAPPASEAAGPGAPKASNVQDNNHAHLVPMWDSGPGEGVVSSSPLASDHGLSMESVPMPSRPVRPAPGRPRVFPKGEDRRARWAAEQAAAGIVRVYVRAHEDDAERVRAYAARLLKRRGLT